MPKAIEADWEAIKNRYLTGSLPKELSADFGVSIGVINKRIARGGWHKQKTEIRQNVNQLVRESLAETSKEVRQGLANEVLQQTKALQAIPLDGSMPGLTERAELAGSVAATSAKVFCWDAEPTKSIINIAFLDSTTTPIMEPIIPIEEVAG